MPPTITWAPQPRQLKFLQSCGLSYPFDGSQIRPPIARAIGYGGSAGGGKSDALLAVGIIGCFTYPGINVGYFRREYPDLDGPGGAIIRSHELLTGVGKWHGGLRRWRMPGNGIIQFCHCKEEKDVYGYQSQQFDILLFDEATQFTRFIVRYLLTRNRATKENVTPFVAMGTNPGGVGHGWFLDEFVDIGPPEQVYDVEVEPGQHERHIFIPAFLADNQILEQRDPGYRATLMAQPEILRKQLLDGDWTVFAGQYFKDFRKKVHVIEPFELDPYWMRFVSLDWGYNDPCAVLWHCVDPEGRVYTYRELYVNQMLPSDIAKMIKELSGTEDISYYVGSPDIWAKRGIGDNIKGESIGEIFLNSGIVIQKADNNRILGWTRMREFLAPAADGIPYWQIFNNCVNLTRTLPSLMHDKHRVEDVSGDCEDHAPESARYGLMSRPRPLPMPIKKAKPLPFELRDDEKPVEYHNW